jgi:hypothetical protein
MPNYAKVEIYPGAGTTSSSMVLRTLPVPLRSSFFSFTPAKGYAGGRSRSGEGDLEEPALEVPLLTLDRLDGLPDLDELPLL